MVLHVFFGVHNKNTKTELKIQSFNKLVFCVKLLTIITYTTNNSKNIP